MRLLCTLALFAVALPLSAQDHDHAAMEAAHHGPSALRAEVRATVDRLFDGMRSGDSTMVRSTMAPEARLVTTFSRDGVPGRRLTPVDAFVTAVGSPHEEMWDERIWNVRIDVRDNLASAWMDYAFYVGEQLSHCGVNAMQLARVGEADWRIIHLADTRTPADACEIPDEE